MARYWKSWHKITSSTALTSRKTNGTMCVVGKGVMEEGEINFPVIRTIKQFLKRSLVLLKPDFVSQRWQTKVDLIIHYQWRNRIGWVNVQFPVSKKALPISPSGEVVVIEMLIQIWFPRNASIMLCKPNCIEESKIDVIIYNRGFKYHILTSWNRKK